MHEFYHVLCMVYELSTTNDNYNNIFYTCVSLFICVLISGIGTALEEVCLSVSSFVRVSKPAFEIYHRNYEVPTTRLLTLVLTFLL